MDRQEVRKALYERYIRPTETERSKYIGIEVEMPIVNLSNQATDQKLTQRVFNEFVDHFGFTRDKYDDNSDCYSATLEDNQDNISFDCSYNNLELSLGKEVDLFSLEDRFRTYVTFLNDRLEKEGHLLTGFGINPNKDVNDGRFIPAERYRMLERYLSKSTEWDEPMYFHPYKTYGTFASASQVQLDVKKEDLTDVIKAFSLLEPIKAVLFANSLIDSEPDLLCTRDLLWENSTHGINSHNIGMFEQIPESVDELLDYIATTSIFNVERDGHYIHFRPIPITEFLNRNEVEGEYYRDGEYHLVTFSPRIEDLEFLRTYKFEDLTFRGTIEFRSCCNQPFSEAMTVPALHVGLMKKVPELLEILENDEVIYNHGYTATELRKLFNKKELPSFVDQEELKGLILKVLKLSRQGLSEREKGEEKLLDPLFERAQTLSSPGRVVYEAIRENKDLNELVKKYASFDK